MNAFTAAASVLAADTNLGEWAQYRPLGRGPGERVRIIRAAATDDHTSFGQAVRTGRGITLMVLSPALRGDTWSPESEAGVPTGEVLTATTDSSFDAENASSTVMVRSNAQQA